MMKLPRAYKALLRALDDHVLSLGEVVTISNQLLNGPPDQQRLMETLIAQVSQEVSRIRRATRARRAGAKGRQTAAERENADMFQLARERAGKKRRDSPEAIAKWLKEHSADPLVKTHTVEQIGGRLRRAKIGCIKKKK
jgi:hypothetical protein